MSVRRIQYEDFAVRLERCAAGGFVARIYDSAAGGGRVSFELPVHAEEIDALMGLIEAQVRGSAGDLQVKTAEAAHAGREQLAADPEDLGRRLHGAILSERVGNAWAEHWGSVVGKPDRGLRLRLVFDSEILDASPLAALPWELLYQGRARGYLARNRLTPVVRHLDVEQTTILPPVEGPLQVLVVAASPVHHPPIDLALEEARIRAAWKGRSPIELEFVRRITLEELRDRLLRGKSHVLHFMGHGEFLETDAGQTEGSLLFENFLGRAERVPASLLAEALKSLTDLRLVVLNACDSARFPRRRGIDPFSSVAAAMVLAGVPSVVAMQFPISDDAAITFGAGLYRALAAGDPVDGAVAEGRVAVTLDNPESLEWATPVLFSRVASGRILGGLTTRPDLSALRQQVMDFGKLIEQKTHDFVGRRFLFDAVEQFRQSKGQGYFQIVADPGVGKSAMLAKMVLEHGWVHHFNQRQENIVRPEAFLTNVCAQLILAHGLDMPELPPEAVRDGNFLSRILGQISDRLEPGSTTVILVDALDESSREGLERGVNPLYLPRSLPEGIVVILTTRPEEPERYPRFDDPVEKKELDPTGPENMADTREYVAKFLPRPGIRGYLGELGLSEKTFVDEMTGKSQGNFMYLVYVLPAIDEGNYRTRTLDEIPDGLENYYVDHFVRMQSQDRKIWLDETLPVLGALAVAEEPIPFELIHEFSGVEDPRRVRDVVRNLRQFLSVSRAETPEGPLKVYRFYHETFFEFIRDHEVVEIDLKKASERAARALGKG